MNKSEYRAARRLIRDNGLYALHWLGPSAALIMDTLHYQPVDMYSDIQSFFKACADTRNRLLYRRAVYLALLD